MGNAIIKVVPKQEIIRPFISDMSGDNLIQDSDIIKELSILQLDLVKRLNIDYFLSTDNSPLAPDYQLSELAINAGVTIEYLTRLRRLHSVAYDLVVNYGSYLTLTAMVQTNSAVIDLFIKTVKKKTFALLLRSCGNARVRWRSEPEKQYFCAYKPGKKHQRWDALDRSGEKLKSVMDLKKAKSPLLGESRSERDQTIVKGVVLCGGTTIYPDDRENIIEFNRAEVLRVYKDSLFFVVEQENLIKFLE
jgi:hypothetical protein